MRTQSPPPLPLIEKWLIVGGRAQCFARSAINCLKILRFRVLVEPPRKECLLPCRFVWRKKDFRALLTSWLRLADSQVFFQRYDLLGSPCGLLHQKAIKEARVSVGEHGSSKCKNMVGN